MDYNNIDKGNNNDNNDNNNDSRILTLKGKEIYIY